MKSVAKGKRYQSEKSWLKGIADGEGYVSKPKTKNGTRCFRCIMISNTDDSIIREIERCLGVLGIEYRTKKKIMANHKPIFVVILSGQKNLKKWFEEIGFVSDQKMTRLKTLVSDYKGTKLAYNDEKQLRAVRLRGKGLSFKEIGKKIGFSEHTVARFFWKKGSESI